VTWGNGTKEELEETGATFTIDRIEDLIEKMEQIERIRQMELRMERAAKAVMELSAALENYEAVQDDIAALEQYYGSEAWKQDYAADEAGLLPANLKRGVLSEDGIWNLLSDVSELQRVTFQKHHQGGNHQDTLSHEQFGL
jgi:hypothetical protein